jgi:hypothetical protein
MAVRPSHRMLLPQALAILVLALVAAGCAPTDSPLPVGDRATPTPTPTEAEEARAAAAATPTPTWVPLPTSVSVPVASESTTAASADKGDDTITIEPTRTPVPLPADYSRSTSGVPIHELVKLAQWDENRLKLSNFIAGYIIAHGLNHPARIIDMDPEGYKDALPNNDVDIVLEADPEWAKPYADAGIIVVLKPLSTASPDTVVAVNASLWKRAPEVGRFLERYEWDGDLLTAESKKIKSGRIAITAAVVGHNVFKRQEEMWRNWVAPEAAETVRAAMEDGKIWFCRGFEVRVIGPYTMRVCKDDPTVNTRL